MKNFSSSARGSLQIGGGAAGGQAILIAVTPLLAWLFGPEEFGRYALLLAAAAIITPVAALKLDTAILLPRTDLETRHVIWCAFLAIALTSLSTLVVVASIEASNGASMLQSAVAGLSAGLLVLSGSLVSTMTQASVRQRNFSVVATRPLIQNACGALLQLIFGLFFPVYTVLVAGQAAGRFAGIVRLWSAGRGLVRFPGKLHLRSVCKKYWRFPLIFMPSSLLNSFGAQLPLLVSGLVGGPATAGIVGMAERVAFSPASIVATAVSQPFAAEMSALKREGRPGALTLYLKTSMRIGVVAIALGLTIAIIGPVLVRPVLGPEWVDLENVLRVLALPVSLNLVFNAVSRVFSIFEAARLSLLADLSRVLLVIAGVAVGILLDAVPLCVYAGAVGGLALSYILSWSLGFAVVARSGT